MDLLQPERRKRLAQIQNQVNLAGRNHLAAFTTPEQAQILGLDAGQIAKYQAADKDRIRPLEALFANAGADDLSPKITKLSEETAKQFTAALTKEQLKKFQDRVGSPFADVSKVAGGGGLGSLLNDGLFLGGKGKGTPPTFRPVARMMLHAPDPTLHKELQLTADEAKKLQAFNQHEDDLAVLNRSFLTAAAHS